MNKRFLFSAATAVVLLLTGPALAEDAGTVLFATGNVTAERQPPVDLAKGDTVLTGDVVVTGEKSRAQIEMIDGAKIAIRPDSRLRIDEYAYTAPAAARTVTTQQNGSTLSLVKGGFRAITGAIADEDPDEYEVRTPVGVLGIRGTDYSAVFCNGDCGWAGAAVPDGLYLGVMDGAIFFRTATETIELGAGEYAFIPLDVPEPERLDQAPPVLLDENDLRFDRPAGTTGQRPGGTAIERAQGFNAELGTRRAPVPGDAAPDGEEDEPAEPGETPAQPKIGIGPNGEPVDLTPGDLPPQRGTSSVAHAFGALVAQTPLPVLDTDDNEPTQLVLDANGDVVGFDIGFDGRTGADTARFAIGTASNVESGSDSVTFLRWGRWAGGAATVTTQSDGLTSTVTLTSQSLHWIAGADNGVPAMPVTGVATYSLIGATSPTDTAGNVGVLGDATFRADFTNMSVDSTLVIGINGQNWSASGTGVIGAQANLPAHLFQGIYNSVDVDGITGGTGAFTGFFSDPGPTSDPAFPGAAGLTYNLTDAQGQTTVSGAAAFGNP